jgi:hypothetical protein
LFSSHISVFAPFEQVLCPPLSAYQSIQCKLMCRLCAGFHFTFRNSMLVYSSTCVLPSSGLSFHIRELDTIYLLSFGLRMCALELFALGLGVGVVDIVCLSNREIIARDAYLIYLVLHQPLAFLGLHFF